MPGKLPIIYVRGYAGSGRKIDEAVDDPLYGFNLGSTHVRVGAGGSPRFYQFESPLLRLITEQGYTLEVRGGQETYLDQQPDGEVPEATVWVHRFYDAAASTYGARPVPYRLEVAARDLLRFVEKVLQKTGAPRVHLVAHSMGGLICRALVQRVIPDTYRPEAPGPRGRLLAADFVDRLFTYGTPHGGIEFDWGAGLLEELRDEFGLHGADVFGPDRMYAYLTPRAAEDAHAPAEWDARDMPDDENFPLDRVFCLIGTNAGDYSTAAGLAAKAVGVKSDGLVKIENAYVQGANHAFVHRSHSGRFGMVNSEEGYQNLVRFLLGDIKVTVDLVKLRLPTSEDLTWQAETRVSVRGLPVVMHEQTAAHHCPIQIEPGGAEDPSDRPVPLVTTYLWSDANRPNAQPSMRYTLQVRLLSLREHDGLFFWQDHQEQVTDFDDTLVVDVQARDGRLVAWATWASQIKVPLRDFVPEGPPMTDDDPTAGVWLAQVRFPASGAFLSADARGAPHCPTGLTTGTCVAVTSGPQRRGGGCCFTYAGSTACRRHRHSRKRHRGSPSCVALSPPEMRWASPRALQAIASTPRRIPLGGGATAAARSHGEAAMPTVNQLPHPVR